MIKHRPSLNLVNIGSGNGLLPDSTKPLPEPMLTNTNRQWCLGSGFTNNSTLRIGSRITPLSQSWLRNLVIQSDWIFHENWPWGIQLKMIWVGSQNCSCLVTWFCYQLIAKPGNKTAAVSWPDTYGKCSREQLVKRYWNMNAQSRLEQYLPGVMASSILI